jgi:hypothetical protein
MDKRLTKTDLAFVLGFLFTLIVGVGAFFYGVKVGADRTEAKYAAERQPDQAAAADSILAYQQQDLVSFYHTVFLPYREFSTEWLTVRGKWLAGETSDLAASLKELARTAERKYDAVKVAHIPPVSPLLKEAQDGYLNSLRLLADSFSRLASEAKSGDAVRLLETVEADDTYRSGVQSGLDAQRAYYEAMMKWGATLDPGVPENYETPAELGAAKWADLPLLVKTKVAADYLAKRGAIDDFLPQDLAAKTDSLIRSGQAQQLNLRTFQSVAELLTGTGAVRAGDFLTLKAQLYGERELLPQLPFFSPGG